MTFEKSRMVGCLEVAIAAIIWGSNGVIVNLIPLSSYVITFFRVSLATLTVSIGILISRRLDLLRPSYPLNRLVMLGVLLCLGWGFLFEAMKLLPIAEAVLLNYMAPIYVAILAIVFLKEQISKRTLI
jgi:drug/metabolite transporter (DMT)-like permease